MPHIVSHQARLRHRVNRLRGQVDAIARLLDEDGDCGAILQQAAACRGALNGLMAEVLEDLIRYHVGDPDCDPESEKAVTTDQVVDLVRSYLK